MEQNRHELNRTEIYAWLFTFVYFISMLMVSINLPGHE